MNLKKCDGTTQDKKKENLLFNIQYFSRCTVIVGDVCKTEINAT